MNQPVSKLVVPQQVAHVPVKNNQKTGLEGFGKLVSKQVRNQGPRDWKDGEEVSLWCSCSPGTFAGFSAVAKELSGASPTPLGVEAKIVNPEIAKKEWLMKLNLIS